MDYFRFRGVAPKFLARLAAAACHKPGDPNPSSLTKLASLGSDVEVHDGWRYILNKHYMSESSSVRESIIAIPDELESVQTLVFMGFSQSAAEATYERFRRIQREHPDEELLAVAKGTVRGEQDAIDDEENWDEAMQSMGMDVALRTRILSPEFHAICRTETAMFWVVETITDSYNFLLSLNETISYRTTGPSVSMTPNAGTSSSASIPQPQTQPSSPKSP